jgi:cytochrome c oxidase subunit 2
MPGILQWPEQASTLAGQIDFVFNVLNAVTVFFSLLIAGCLVYLAVKYRRGAPADRTNAPDEGLAIELIWTIIPAIICVILFTLATVVYLRQARTPEGAMEIYVVGKQWMWKLQHPEGRWEMNELHVPLGRKVKLTMTSEDVIHSFFVPAFRLKQDVLPGRFTTMWFEPTKAGEYHLFCAEYCGTKHSGMIGTVYVQEPADYEKWLRSGNVKTSMAERGEHLFRQLGCGGCHGPGANVRAPMLNGLYGSSAPIQYPDGSTRVIVADQRYIHDAILLPESEIAAGYKPIMPTFKNQLDETEVLELIEYIKSLSTANGGRNSAAAEPSNPGTSRPDTAPLASPGKSTASPDTAPLASKSRFRNERTEQPGDEAAVNGNKRVVGEMRGR